jgi:3-hydroxymyristoyl/3-hydroxydecanoyl-(acyl carrier protein) dehydratase/1-acyl-sn-glycerol-3-phosphate acyltransferase
LRLQPQAAIGFCSGETNALFALGAWRDMDALRVDIDEAGLYSRELAGEFAAVKRAWKEPGSVRWSSWRLLAPIERVREALAGETRAYLSILNAPGDCVVAGDADACRRVVDRVGPERARSLAYDVAVHCPEMAEYRDEWRRLHRRPTFPVPGVRFYTHATLDHYAPTADSAADALLGQAMGTVDFPRLILKAWQDGVRVFVEHGPQGGCTHWISRILGEREHLAVALDLAGESPLRQAAHAVAELVAAGVSVDYQGFAASFPMPASFRPAVGKSETTRVRYPVHRPLPLAPPLPALSPARSNGSAEIQLMAPAPWLPRVTEEMVEATLTPAPFVSEIPPADVPAPLAHLLEQVVAHQRRVGEVHRAFLAEHAAVHARFLDLQARSPFGIEAAPPARLLRGPDLPPAAVILPAPPAVRFSRAQLETLAGGAISSVFGPMFRQQDGYRRQVRMPLPPLLLADRVTAIEAEPGTMGKGTIRTETDVRGDSWYLHEGRMPAGIMIEAGQADLLLISWLGIDLLNRGERVYRLLGCELTYHGGLPRPGDTLRYDIQIDSHAQQGDIRLFFFHYDCRIDGQPRLSVRNGQAGFFTDRELAEAAGVLWDPATAEHRKDGPLDPPAVSRMRTSFTSEDVRAFSEGRVFDCFGPGYERARTHVRPPRIASGRMRLLDEVTDLDPTGGPWGRGYLRAETRIAPDDWFFAGHFKNDPCMPGTLMFEGCLEAMAFYLTALGFALDKDGWLFEPVPEETYSLRCRGQVTPVSRLLVCELFVEEVSAGPHPTIYADLLGSVDGLKAFHCRRMGLRLVPDWPLTSRPELAVAQEAPGAVAEVDGFRFGGAALLACAWGRPSDAFGPMYAGFDGARRAPRLPGPPYLFMSRIRRFDGPLGKVTPGLAVEAEYDVPAAAWYFEENTHPVMPWSVLLEVALQPCGWLAAALGIASSAGEDLFFRNLDGTATVFREIGPAAGTIRTAVTLKSLSRAGGMVIVSFELSCFLGDEPVCRITPVFGFFPKEALAQQVGLTLSEDGRAWAERASAFRVDLRERPARYCAGDLRLPGPMLLMLDRVTGYWPDGGRAGLGRLRAEKDVDAGEWFFKAHFFQDPVQPGSLGLEAMLQLLEFYAIERGLAAEIGAPRFSPLAGEGEVVWKYRGQVLPENRRVVVEAEVLRVDREEAGVVVVADAWLTVDGVSIYSATNLRLRVAGLPQAAGAEEVLDPAVETWIEEHRPTYVLPTLPMMCMVDRLAAAARAARPGGHVVGLRDVEMRRWIAFDGRPVRLKTEVRATGDDLAVTLLVWRDAPEAHRSRFEPAATGIVRIAADYPPAPPALPPIDAPPVNFPYDALGLGPRFQVGRRLAQDAGGATAWLDAKGRGVPHGLLNASLLDGALHATPRDHLGRWFSDLPGSSLEALVCFPSQLPEATFHGPPPASGEVRCEVRPEGLDAEGRRARFHIQLIGPDGVWADLRIAERLSPKGRVGMAAPADRLAFLAERAFVPGLGLSRSEGGVTRLTLGEVKQSDWLPGTVTRAYGLEGSAFSLVRRIAVMDHVGQRVLVHPSEVEVATDCAWARVPSLPLTRFPVSTTGDEAVAVTDAGPEALDTGRVGLFWRERLGLGPSLVEDLLLGLSERYVRRVVLADPPAFHALEGRSAILLANHQVGIESLAASILLSGLRRQVTVTLAKAEHRQSWVGELIARSAAHPGVRDPGMIAYFDRSDERSLLAIVGELGERLRAGTHSLLVHVEGTRALSCSRPPVTRMSSLWLDLAMAAGAPIIPVRLRGGLPVGEAPARLEFPTGHGRQDYWLGRPILPEELHALPFGERSRRVLDAINRLGPAEETPLPPEPAFAAAVEEWVRATGTDEVRAVFWRVLEGLRGPSEETRALVEGGHRGRLVLNGGDAGHRWLAEFARLVFGPRGPGITLE